MTVLTDADAIVVSTASMASKDQTTVVQSNISFVNALFDELLTSDEQSPDAMRSYYVDYCYAQIMNGGFSQLVYNSRWNERVIGFVRSGLEAMGAMRELAAFEVGAKYVARVGRKWLEQYIAADYFGENPTRDAFDGACDARAFRTLQAVNARWLRAHPKLVVVTAADMEAEVKRRGAALPDRAERIAKSRANETRDLKLIRALCERAGHELDRRTAAALLSYQGSELWGYFFVTDRGPHVMLDLDTRALMFPTDAVQRPEDVVDAARLVVEVPCAPATPDDK